MRPYIRSLSLGANARLPTRHTHARCAAQHEAKNEAQHEEVAKRVELPPFDKPRALDGQSRFGDGSRPRSRARLKKSRTMQKFEAALAAKSRNGVSQPVADMQPIVTAEESTLLEDEVAVTDGTAEEIEDFGEPFETSLESPYPLSKQELFENDPNDFCVLPKPIYIVSDCTGDSAARTVRAALNQFETSIKTHCPASILIYQFISDKKRIKRIVKDAAKENALLVFTLVDPDLVATIQNCCSEHEVRSVDLWSHLLDLMEDHLDALRSSLPMLHPSRLRKRALNADYFKRIEAVEFTRKMDDGAHPERWKEADILLLGVSRSGKTPLSIYLGQRGYKVANLPLIEGHRIPPELYQIDQSKIFALFINHEHLMKIRRSRMGVMGVKNQGTSTYAELQGVIQELNYAKSLYAKNPIWPVLDVTCMGVEESSAEILRILSERLGPEASILFYDGS